jgi:hypothetical protein
MIVGAAIGHLPSALRFAIPRIVWAGVTRSALCAASRDGWNIAAERTAARSVRFDSPSLTASCRALTRLALRCPPDCSPSVMFPRFGPVGGLAVESVRTHYCGPLPLRRGKVSCNTSFHMYYLAPRPLNAQPESRSEARG